MDEWWTTLYNNGNFPKMFKGEKIRREGRNPFTIVRMVSVILKGTQEYPASTSLK